MKSKNVLYMVRLAMLIGIMVILNFTPIGFLRIGPVEMSFLAIPVILGAILMGPLAGLILGLVFGALSFALAPTHPIFGVAFAQNPFIVAIVCFVPRILTGVIPAYLARQCEKIKNTVLVHSFLGVTGSLINTVLFLSGVVFLLGSQIIPTMTQMGLLAEKTFNLFWVSTGLINGIPEAIATGIIVPAISVPIKKYIK